jgi:hypothetical protein
MLMDKRNRVIVLLLALSLFFLAGFHERLHNHKTDFRDHPDCPVFFFLNSIQVLPGFCTALLFLLRIVFFRYQPQNEKIRPKVFVFSWKNRAPPF